MSRPNNKRPNNQQRESQDIQAKQTEDTTEFLKEQLNTGEASPIASVQRKDLF